MAKTYSLWIPLAGYTKDFSDLVIQQAAQEMRTRIEQNVDIIGREELRVEQKFIDSDLEYHLLKPKEGTSMPVVIVTYKCLGKEKKLLDNSKVVELFGRK
jgi:hypothetical protein